MKYLLMSVAFVAANAMACPADDSKDAMAPASGKPAVAAKTTPATTAATTKATPVATKKAATKVADKSAVESRKSSQL